MPHLSQRFLSTGNDMRMDSTLRVVATLSIFPTMDQVSESINFYRLMYKGNRLIYTFRSSIEQVAWALNERPWKTLEYEIPAERFNACVTSIG